MGIDLELWRARIGLFNASRVPRLHSRVNLVNVSVDTSLLTALCGAVLTVFIPYTLLTHILCTSQLPHIASVHTVYTLHPLYVLSSFTSLAPVLRLMSCLLVTVGVLTVSHSSGHTLSISGYKISQKMIIILLLSYSLAHLLILAGDVETNPGPERGAGGEHLSSIFHALKYGTSAPLRMLPLLVAGVPGAGITTLLKHLFPKITFARKSRATRSLQAVLTEKGCFELDQAVVVLQQVLDGVKAKKALKGLEEVVSSKELALAEHTHQSMLPPGFKGPMDFFKDVCCSDVEGYFADKWCTVYLTDMGGQHNFEAIIPAFVTMPSVFLLVVNLNEDLACKHGSAATHFGLTPQEVIMQSLTSIDCVIHSLPHGIKPKVVLVGTHMDLISEKQFTNIDDLLQALIRDTEVESLVHFASPTQMLFPVNSLTPDDPGIHHLQAALKHFALNSEEFQVTVLLKWLIFNAILQQTNKPVLIYEQCFQVAGTCGIDTYNEFDDALQFLHTRVGVLRYFPMINEHRNIVIIKPDYLVNVLSNLVTANFTEKKEDQIALREFKKTGLLAMEFYQTASKHSNELLTASKVLALLEYHHTAVRCGQTGATFFIPCILSSSPYDHSASFHSSDIAPLLIHFDCGYCPVGLFSSLVVHLAENKPDSKVQWNLITEKMFRDQICLHVEPCHSTVRLTKFLAYYSVELISTDVTACKMSLGELCVEVRRCIEDGLKVSMNYTTYNFELALLCPDPESKLHPHPSVIKFRQDQRPHVECVKTGKYWKMPPKSSIWFECQEDGPMVVADSPVGVTQLPPQGVSVLKPPIEKPALQELAVIPLEESQWYILGQTLGLKEGLLKSIQHGTSNPTKCKREMFKNWLKEKHTKASWHVLLGALRKIGATDVAEVVRSEYSISDSSDSEEVSGGEDEVDAGFSEDVDITKAKMGSTSRSEKHHELPKPPEYMAFEACYQQLMTLVSEQPDDYVGRAFSRALIDTSKLDNIRSSLVTDEEKATELLREIGQMIRTSIPQAFERFLLILTANTDAPIVQRLNSITNAYKVLIEFQKLSTSEINLDALAEEFFNKGLIAPSSYEECIQTDENLPKAMILYERLSKLKASHPFVKLLSVYSNTKDVAEVLKRESGTSSPSSEDSSGYLTGRTEDLESSLGSTSSWENQRPIEDAKPWESGFSSGYLTGQMEELDSRIESRNDQTLTKDAILDATMYPSLESSTSSDQFHSLDSQNGTMVLGTLKERLSESTLPSLERQSSTVTPFMDTSTPKEKSEKSAVYPFQFQAEAQTLFDDPAEKFMMTVERNDPASIDSLLRRQEVTVDQVLKDGRTGLHLAAASGYHDVVKVLLHHKCTVDARDHGGITPLYLATYYGNYEVMKMLVGAFANVNAVTKDGTPVLLYPASKGYSMVTEYLLENGANANLADNLGVTPLITATRKGQRDVVAVLLRHGADVNAVSLETSRTALQEAVHREYTEIVTMLIKAQSAADERSHALFTCKTAEMLRKLVKGGARVDDRQGDGATPLIVHTDQGNFEVVKLLVEFNANVDLQDQAGFSALMKAAKSGNLEILQVLINAEAILDLKSKQGLTALMYAVQNRSEQAAKKLLLVGADGNARDKGGKTVVEMAEERGCVETVRLLKRQTAVSNTSDPFVHLLSSYLGKEEGSKRSIQPSSTSRGASPVVSRKHTRQHAAAGPPSEMSLVPMSHHVVPKPRSSDIEDSTMRDQLSKAWKRIADLETRIHDLTLQATMEPPPESDLTYLDRSRLEEEYRKLKELKKKAEYYAVEAKQTAQRLSAENFKLKEDLSRERHHNELTRKNMIREMEQKMDKSATALDRADARLEVFEQEVNERALQMIRRMSAPTALALQLPGATTQLEPSFVKDLILKQKIRASFVVIGIAGLPYSGKSTLLGHILEMQHSQEEHARITLPGGLSMFEAVMMKDKINEECKWINSTRLDAEVLAIAVALAHVCAKSQQNPSFVDFAATKPGTLLFKDSKVDECFQKSFERLKKMMKWVQQQGKMDKLMTSSLTFANIYDMGVNKAVFEVLGILTNQFKNLLLVNALSLKDAQGDGLHRSPNLKDKERYKERGDSEMTMKLHSCLKYYTEIIAATPCVPQSTVLVGTFADKLTETELQQTRTEVLHSVNGRAEAVGIMEAICPGMFTIDARSKEQALEVRAALEGMIEKKNFEMDIKLSWIFLRGVLFQTKKLFMSRSEMLVLAKKCGLESEEELEEFLKLFLISGSIVYSPSDAFPVLQQHTILDPIAFISGLDKLYYIHTNHSIPDNLKEDLESTKNGFLSLALAKHLWNEHDFYLQVLETLGLIVQVNEIPKKSFFMPSLRLKHDATMPDADSDSLIITHNLDALPYYKLSSFVIYLTNLYKDQIEFDTDIHYNVIRFKWHTPAAKCYVRFRGEFVDIGIKIAENCSLLQHATLCSILKTACIELFNGMVQDLHGLKYNLAIVCPESKQPEKRLHFIPFHATQYDCNHLFCPKCECRIEETAIPPARKLWIRAAYQGVPGEIFYPEDFLSTAEMGEIVDRLSQQPFERVQCLAYKLGFTRGEFTEKSQGRSIKDLVFFLLLEWKRRSPTNTKQSLALLIMSCGHYTEALRLDPTLPASARPLTPDNLTTKELAFVAQSVARNWVELAQTLGLQETDIQEIQKTYRTHGEQSFQMLERWLQVYSSQQTLPAPISLIKALKSINYHHLADFIETETQQAVLK